MREWTDLIEALGRSSFRSRFRLGPREWVYLQEKGMETIAGHAREFILARLAPAQPDSDGKQTPKRNHPVFIAQHATGSCCRKCLEKWHRIRRGRPLTDEQIDYIVGVLCRWLEHQSDPRGSSE